jgi:hypothetical protein
MLKSPLLHKCKHYIIIHLKTIPYHETISVSDAGFLLWGEEEEEEEKEEEEEDEEEEKEEEKEEEEKKKK